MKGMCLPFLFAFALITGGLIQPGHGHARDFTFVATDLSDSDAIWLPSVLMLPHDEGLRGGVVFILKNLSSKEHVFQAAGLYEVGFEKGSQQVDPGVDIETMEHVLRPLKVTVAPKETKRVRISSRNLLGRSAIGKRFRFFCPIHQDAHLGGSIYVTE